MNRIYDLYEEIEQSNDIELFYYDVGRASVIIEQDRQYGIFLDLKHIKTLSGEIVCLAHEISHAQTGTTHSVYSPLQLVSKNEYKADKRAVHKLIPFQELQAAFDQGIIEKWELAEYFEVTEDFIETALLVYRNEGVLEASASS